MSLPPAPRVATTDDVDAISTMIAAAFETDPVWGVALASFDAESRVAYWRFFVEGALPHGAVYLADGAAAVAVWLPPGAPEVTDEQEVALRSLVVKRMPADQASALFELWDRLDGNHPYSEPHAYLSLLATHPDHRGQGIGQLLLAQNLADLDEQGVPSYLESSNPANNHRYERAGFTTLGEFRTPLNDAPLRTMWRAAATS